MKNAVTALVLLSALVVASSATAAGWGTSVQFTNQVASSPTKGGGYPDPDGSNAPVPGTCRLGNYNANHSESWLAVKPNTEDLVGSSKLFFEKYSTFYNFHLGAFSIPNGTPAKTVQIPGYDCVSTGTQAMPPSWTNNTDPNVDFDTKGRAYQVTLPFNAYWTNLHPNGAIGAVYSDDLGKSWTVANGGKYLEQLNNQSSFAFGAFEDKQWVAVNHVPLSRYQDHVYAMWSIFNGNTVKLRESVSRDRGQTFTSPVTITMPSQTGPATTYVYPSVDANGDLYVALAAFDASAGVDANIYVTRSTDDGQTFAPWTLVGRAHGNPGDFVNGNFRDGILENFAASPTYGGHAYVTYEDWNSATGTMDVRFSYTTDGGFHWSAPAFANDAATVADSTDQFQPSVAAGPNGAVAVAFYDRRAACGSDRSIAQTGRSNACIDVSLQAYKDNGATVARVGSNARITQYPWDPSEPRQTVDGIGQIACSGHDDPCTDVFLGDYFGLAISQSNVYALFVSTHYASNVKADGGGPVYYQQQVLAPVPRSGVSTGY
jgi:predicted small secreted protein